MQTISNVIILMLANTVVDGQQIYLKLHSLQTICQDGLRRGEDSYTITGVVGPGFLKLLDKDWKSSIIMQAQTKPTEAFKQFCQVLIGPFSMFCSSNSHRECYCDHLNNITDSAYFILKSLAKISQSEAVVRAMWQNNNGTSIYSSNNVPLPKVYDSNTARLTLKVNNEPALHPDNCGIKLVPYATNNVELCCENTASPCYPRISFNNIIVTDNSSHCVNFSFVVQNETFTTNVISSYSVCSSDSYVVTRSFILHTAKLNFINLQVVIMVCLLVLIACVTIAFFTAFIFVYQKVKLRRQKFSRQESYYDTRTYVHLSHTDEEDERS